MANFSKSHPQNAPGPLFTDTSCIDCGTCFHLGPRFFKENEDDKSVVIYQPETVDDWQKAKQAIVSCPTNSIGVREAPAFFKDLSPGLPALIDQNVYYLGYTSRDSFGATSYLITSSQGNVLVDSPRFHPHLVKELESFGSIRYMFLSHEDDVADHQKFRDHFGLERIIHEKALSEDTKNCEIILKGEDDVQLRPDLKVVMTPGHTQGHMALVYDSKYLFTGDHLFVDQGHLSASSGVCWYSWEEQIKSMEKLLKVEFQWALPGHGGWSYFDVQRAKSELQSLILKMKGKS